jgi:hypothetical protein
MPGCAMRLSISEALYFKQGSHAFTIWSFVERTAQLWLSSKSKKLIGTGTTKKKK